MTVSGKVEQTVFQYSMLKQDDRIIIGVSGGPDSMALLYILRALREELNLKLFVAHLNHMIRRNAAVKDAVFVKKTAERLNLPFIMETSDVPKMARDRNLSMEEAARDARYEFYLRAARKFNANKIALGHTADDQAETVLMRLIRGSGLLGLAGIPPKRDFEGTTIIRPLLEVSKNEIEEFLKAEGISFRQDLTNLDPVYFRNKIRHKLLPILEKEFNPEIKKVLKETGRNLRVDYEYLSGIAGSKFRKYSKIKKGQVIVNLKFLGEDLAIQRMIIRNAIKTVKGDLSSVSYNHLESLNNLLTKKSRWSLDLPGKILVRKIKGHLLFCKGSPKGRDNLEGVIYHLEVPGKIRLPGINKTIESDFIGGRRGIEFRRHAREEYFDFEKLKQPIFIRFRNSKDKIRPFGMNKYKRVKSLFIDEKVPAEKRSRVPLVISGNNIIWVCGIKRADHAKITNCTKRVLRIRLGRE